MRHLRSRRSPFVLALVAILGAVDNSTAGHPSRRAARDWSKLDLVALEEEWKDGDDERELITADEELYRLSERRRDRAMERLHGVMDSGGGELEDGMYAPPDTEEFERLVSEAQHAGKPGMIFAKVRQDRSPPKGKKKQREGTEGGGALVEEVRDGGEDDEAKASWDWDSLAEICEEWRYRLEFKMVDIACYPMEPDSVLITVKKGWHSQDVFEYLSQQGEVLTEVSWNDKKVNPSERRNEDDEL